MAGFRLLDQGERIKEQISYMPQRFALYTDLTVTENIRFYAHIFRVPRHIWKARYDELLKMSGLYEFKDRLAHQLSGGMKQKLALICALIHIPKILLLDEPTNGVDPVSRRDFWNILYALLKEKVTILVSTAYLDEAERCNRIGLLHSGSLLLEGTPAAIKKQFSHQVLEINTREREKVKTLLLGADGIRDVIFSGDRAHVHVGEVSRQEPIIRERLSKAGIQVDSISHVPPTLEDVFISLIAGKAMRQISILSTFGQLLLTMIEALKAGALFLVLAALFILMRLILSGIWMSLRIKSTGETFFWASSSRPGFLTT